MIQAKEIVASEQNFSEAGLLLRAFFSSNKQ